MKKATTILTCLFAAMTVAGCMREDPTTPRPSREDMDVHLDATTTRASVSTITDMHTGFRVFAAAGDISSTRDWYSGIDGTNNHVYSGGQWGFQTPVQWPSDQTKYPLSFYAWYPAGLNSTDGFSLTANPAATDTELFADITVQSSVATQVDILAGRSTVAARPTGGSLVMTFDHIFSKIDFGIIPGREVTPEIMSLGIINVGDTRTYDFITGGWTSTQPNLSGSVIYYEYYGNFWASQLSGGAVPFLNIPWSPGTGYNETTPVPFYHPYTNPSAADAHLMLMPQTSPVWDPSSVPNPGIGDGAIITVLYRMTTHGGVDEVGFASARNHPDFTEGGYEGPLYVLAGFPLPADTNGNFTWTPGKGYTYNIGLGTSGSSNGYLMYPGYWDENGNPSMYRMIGSVNEGEPLNDGVIHIDLDVDNWGDDDGGDLPPWVDKTPTFVDERAPYILYWDDATQTMQVGSWNAVSGGNVTTANQLFFQAASVVGFLNAGDGWDNTGSQIMFNPTTITDTSLASGYLNIPDWTNSVEATTPAPGFTADGFISSANYHYRDNVFAGYGDPCKLAGLTEEQVKAGAIDNGKWVMARWDDIRTGYTAYGTMPGTTTPNTSYGMAVNGATDTFLPASGWRNYSSGGAPASIGVQGWYWSSKPMEARYITTLRLDGSTVYSTMAGDGNLGIPVRCVGVTQYPADVTANAGGSVVVSLFATGNTNAKAVRATQGQSLTFTATPTAGYVFAGWSSTRFTLTDEQKAKNPLSLSMPGSPIRLTASFKEAFVSRDVTFNGVTWAGANVATSGTFAPTALMYDGTSQYSWTQVQTNDFTGPCPAGWRMPTTGEINSLLTNSTSRTYRTDYDGSGINGLEIVTPNGTLFFAASGYANGTNAGTNGYYRTSTHIAPGMGSTSALLLITPTNAPGTQFGSDDVTYSVRCVKDDRFPVSALAISGGTAKVTSDTAGTTAITMAKPGSNVTFTATPTDGTNGFAWWTLSGAGAALLTDVNASDLLRNPLTITMPAEALIAIATFRPTAPPRELTISNDSNGTGGAIWSATDLVNTGVYALESDVGRSAFFQWARAAAWAHPGVGVVIANWNREGTDQLDATLWPEATDPCPDGWRVPTLGEWNRLYSSSGRQNNVGDRTLMSPGGGITFFAGGYINAVGVGLTHDLGTGGYYWLNNSASVIEAVNYSWWETQSIEILPYYKADGFLMKCVRDLPPTLVPNPVGEVEIPSADGTYTTVWAKTNLKAAGVFADNETDYGVIFQWGRNRAYTWASAVYANDSDGDDTSGTKGLIPSAADQTGNATWPASTDPCPYGWRVPTRDEYSRLVAVMTDGFQQNPRILSNATYGNLAFPAVGLISVSGTGSGQGSNGGYWSNAQAGIDSAYDFRWTTTYNIMTLNSPKVTGYSVRCVRTL